MEKKISKRQRFNNECGLTSIYIFLKYYGSTVPIRDLRNHLKSTREGTSLYEMENCLASFGFNSNSVYIEDLLDLENHNVTFPIISHVIVENIYMHYLVIIKKTKLGFLISDPGTGNVKEISTEEFKKITTGFFLIAEPSSQYTKIKKKNRDWIFLLKMSDISKIDILLLWTLTIIVSFIGLLNAYFMKFLFDFIVPNKELSILNIVVICLINIFIINILISHSKNIILNKFSQKIYKNLLEKFLYKTITLSMSFFNTVKIGDLLTRIEDIAKIVTNFTKLISTFLIDIFTIILTGCFIFVANKLLFIMLLIFIPIYFLLITFFWKKTMVAVEDEILSATELNSLILDSLHGIETIKTLNSEKIITKKFDSKIKKFQTYELKKNRLDSLQSTINQNLELIFNLLIIYVCSTLVINEKISIGEMMTINTLSIYFLISMQNLITIQPLIINSKISLHRLTDIFFMNDEKNETEKYLEEKLNHVYLEISNMNLVNQKKINISIKRNEKICFTGNNGAGKTTLAKMIAKLYPIDNGNVIFKGRSIKDVSENEVRESITYVPQKPYLFHGTIKENIELGLEFKPDFNKLDMVLRLVDLDEFLKKIPMGIYSLVEENASNLSGGQIQKIILARALMKNSELLILDEATSAIDKNSEKKILKNLSKLEKTIIFISHDLEIIDSSDKVYYF